MQQITSENLQDFQRFIFENGGQVLKAEETFSGGYVFTIQGPYEGFAKEKLAEFMNKK